MSQSPILTGKNMLASVPFAEKLQNCFECGICTSSCPMTELLPEKYSPRELLERIFLAPESALFSESLWLCAWCYRCNRHCPQGLKLPEVFLTVRKTSKERGHLQQVQRALKTIAENIPLPLVTIRVCFHPERAGIDENKALADLEHYYAEYLAKVKAIRAQKVSEAKIAVIGSGPAGLTLAYELSKKGYGVSVFEALPEPGGMLRKCIPEFRLPKQLLSKEIQFLRDLGIEIRTGIRVGEDLSFNELKREGYKAVFIGVGAHKNQKLRIEGADLKGVIHSLDFLWEMNCNDRATVGKNVIVIGGGNVAVDAARTALNKGAEHATLLYRRSREEMTAIPWELEEAEKEGVRVELLAAPKRILGTEGNVSALQCIRMQLGEPDESGRRTPLQIEGSEFTLETDMIISAIGETPDLEFLPKEIELTDDGTIWVDQFTMESSTQGIFAGGDAVTGPATVIEAIRGGKRAAESIDAYLKSQRADAIEQ